MFGDEPYVTILMASYGRLPMLKQSVDSALSQQYSNFEILIVDDGSDDETRRWLRSIQQQHECLRVVFQGHQGVAVARAKGVTEAHGDLICILDSDDTLVPHALRRLTDKIKSHPGSVLVYTSINELRPGGAIRTQTYPVYHSARDMLWAVLMSPRVPFKHSGTLFHRKTAIELGSYDCSLPCKVDIDLYLKFLRAGYLPALVVEPLVNFRMHKDSVSRDRSLGLRVWFLLIDRYGPANWFIRSAIKIFRLFAENLKRLYMEIAG